LAITTYRVGTTTAFYFGDNITQEQVNYNGDWPYANGAEGLNRQKTVPVKSLPANPWCLYEMHGNVLEWCADWWSGAYAQQPVVDPQGPQQGQCRVLRGGSYMGPGGSCRSAFRASFGLDCVYEFMGFRLALGQKSATEAG
jgi:formylglycine-generating enzyme required for sulfatase activity